MSLAKWNNTGLIDVVELDPPEDLGADASWTSMTNYDVTQHGPNARFLIVITVLPNEATDAGMTFKIQDTTASGGSDVDVPASNATTGASVPGTTSQARHIVELAYTPQAGRPWITVIGTKVSAATDVTVGAHLIAYRNV